MEGPWFKSRSSDSETGIVFTVIKRNQAVFLVLYSCKAFLPCHLKRGTCFLEPQRYSWTAVDCKFMCPTVRPNKPKRQSLEQRTVHCKGQAKRVSGSCSKKHELPDDFLVSFRAPRCVTFFWLVGGEVTRWCTRNLVLSLKLPCLFDLYAEYIMRNAGLDEAQAGIKIAGRNINNLR